MGDLGLTNDEWGAARRVCSARQLVAMRLRDGGMSWREVALSMDGQPSVTTVKDLVRRGIINSRREMAHAPDPE